MTSLTFLFCKAMEKVTCSTDILTFLSFIPLTIQKYKTKDFQIQKKANMYTFICQKILMEVRILKDVKDFCSHWESEMLWMFSTHQALSIYPTKYNRSFAAIWITGVNKDNFKVTFSFAQSLLNCMSQEVIKFLFSIIAEILHFKAGPLRTGFSLRSNDFNFGGFFPSFGFFWSFFVGENNFCLIVTTSVFLSPGHQVKRL